MGVPVFPASKGNGMGKIIKWLTEPASIPWMAYFVFGIIPAAGLILSCCHGHEPRDNKIKSWYTQLGRDLIECPTAEVAVTSTHHEDGRLAWDEYIRSWSVTGCGLKVCCFHDFDHTKRNGQSCFPCKKEQWYQNGQQ